MGLSSEGEFPTRLSTCPPRPKANGTERNQYLTKDCSRRVASNRGGFGDYYSEICLSHQGEVNPIVTLNSTQVLQDFELFFSQFDPPLRMKRKQSVGGKEDTILSATGITSSRSQRLESTDVISSLCQKGIAFESPIP